MVSQLTGSIAAGLQSQLKPGDTTTIDLMYSYEQYQNKVLFSEDTIKKMSLKLKKIRTES